MHGLVCANIYNIYYSTFMSKSNCTQQGHDEVNVYRESHYLCVDQGNVDPGVAKGKGSFTSPPLFVIALNGAFC